MGLLKSTPEGFWARVDRSAGPNACWLWTGGRSKGGYGQAWMWRRVHTAHRIAFLLAGGIIPRGYQVDHLCAVRLCVNPRHLEAVTPAENTRRRTRHCPTCACALKGGGFRMGG